MRAHMTFIRDIILYHHLGMGDHFTCNGLVHSISSNFTKIFLICKERYYPTIKHMYEDFTYIEVVPIQKEPEDIQPFAQKNNLNILSVGFQHIDPMRVERSFYEQLDLPYDLRFTNFKLPKNLEGSKKFYERVKSNLGNDYVFVHNQSSDSRYNLQINTSLQSFVCSMQDTNDLFDYVYTMINAKEIHVINSSLYCLMISLYKLNLLNANKIVFHNCRSFTQGGNPPEVPLGIITKEYITL